MDFFANLNNQGKSIDLERLLNEAIKAIYDWETNKTKDRAISTANTIKNNTYKIIQLYGDLLRASNNKNIRVKNKILPVGFPVEFAAITGIQTIFESASELEAEYPMFKESIITSEMIKEYAKITYPI